MHLSPRGLQKGGNDGKSATTSPPPTAGSRSGMVCPLRILVTWKRYRRRGAISIKVGGGQGEKEVPSGQNCSWPLSNRALLSGPCYCVSLSATPPPRYLPKASRFLRGSELLTNLEKMLWKTLSTKTDPNS